MLATARPLRLAACAAFTLFIGACGARTGLLEMDAAAEGTDAATPVPPDVAAPDADGATDSATEPETIDAPGDVEDAPRDTSPDAVVDAALCADLKAQLDALREKASRCCPTCTVPQCTLTVRDRCGWSCWFSAHDATLVDEYVKLLGPWDRLCASEPCDHPCAPSTAGICQPSGSCI